LKVSSSSLVQGRVVVRLFVCTMLAWVLAACSGREQQQEERAKRARQMRDVSRMLDAMEADKPAAAEAPSFAIAPPASPAAIASPIPPANTSASGDRSAFSLLATLAIAITAGLAIPAFAMFAWRRRRKRVAEPAPEVPSIAAFFVPSPDDSSAPATPPAWVYRSTPFETPAIYVVPEPVDLLVPSTVAERAASTGLHARPAAWQALIAESRALPRHDADLILAMAESEAMDALKETSGDARAQVLAQWLRIRLTRAEKLSGATRLLAVRNLLAAVADDPDTDATVVVEARIDAQLAWASWVMGDAADTRLGEAERLCERLAKADPDVDGRVLRRRGEVCLQRARLGKTSLALPELDRAQAFFDEAHLRAPDAETALLVAQTALRRARLLPPADAADACSHALVHAFHAEQDPACRTEAIACRLDIQLVYETLPDHIGQDGVTASLGRHLEATGPLAPAARAAVAEAYLRDGAHAKAASLCESIWRDGSADGKVFELWRKACRRWAGTEGHDERTLAQSLRCLAIARSTS
jgi:tetratricopeptide (TPR) repeat protein